MRTLSSFLFRPLPVLALAAVGLGRAADAQSVFVPKQGPRHYVPLSPFTEHMGPGAPSNEVVLVVKNAILAWLDGHPSGVTKIALKTSAGQLFLEEPPSGPPAWTITYDGNDPEGFGTVTFTNTLSESVTAVLVNTALENEFPIVTHWSMGDPGDPLPRGARVFGARDTLGGADPPIENKDDQHPVPGTSEQYFWRSDVYNLFSDGSGRHLGDTVPGPEKYIGENYTLAKFTNLEATELSDTVLQATGYPILHRNYNDDSDDIAFFDTSAPGSKLNDDLPVIQVLHNYVVPYAIADDGTPATDQYVGNEESLATFLLPPGWYQASTPTFPILFNGFYDNTGSLKNQGPEFLESLTAAATQGDVGVGVLWNGGGHHACQTMHGSAHGNAQMLLFEKVPDLLGGDVASILLVGGSRGGTTALELVSSLTFPPGGTVIVQADAPQLLHGETIRDFMRPTYPALMEHMQRYTGFKDAYFEDWVVPAGHDHAGISGRVLTAHNLTAVEIPVDPEDIYHQIDNVEQLPPLAPDRVSQLMQNGVQLILRASTHDETRPMSQAVRYVNALRAADYDVRFEVSYRAGHVVAQDQPGQPQVSTLFNSLFDPPYVVTDEDVHYRRASPSTPFTYEEFHPCHIPFSLEMPVATTAEQKQAWVVSGEAGTLYLIRLQRVGGGPPVYLSGLLPASGTGSSNWSYEVHTPKLPLLLPPGDPDNTYYLITAAYELPGQGPWVLSTGTESHPVLPPTAPAPALFVSSSFYHGYRDVLQIGSHTGGLGSDAVVPICE